MRRKRSGASHASVIGAIAIAAIAGLTFGSGAEAQLRCEGRYQVLRGGETIATPYCEDLYLARVAQRSYGVSTSFGRIKNSIHEKERVCRIIGHDHRVNDICMEFLNERSNRYDR